MADSTTHLDVVDELQEDIIEMINELFDAVSPAATFGRHATVCVGFTFGIYGGKKANGTQIPTVVANQTFDLTPYPSSTVYLYVDEDGIGSLSLSDPDDSPTPDGTLIYTLVTGTSSITSYTDHRTGGTGGGSSEAWGLLFSSVVEVGDNILLTRASDGKQLLLGPFA